MKWFWFSIAALLCWSGSDLFSKIGCRDADDKHSHLKMTTAVGFVMGLHALFEIFVNGVDISLSVIWTYLPVSILYILSMALGYVGLRYIELSISSPICNSSGALVSLASILFLGAADEMVPMQFVAVGLVCAGVIALGFVEAGEDDELRAARQSASNYKYAKSWLALALPLAYCLLDAAGTFSDNLVLGKLQWMFTQNYAATNGLTAISQQLTAAAGNAEALTGEALSLFESMGDPSSNSANVAYELTFLFAGAVCFIYTFLIKREKPILKRAVPKYVGAAFETAGQFAYIFAISDETHLAMSAPIISSYCAASVLWSRIFLKEKLSWKHYLAIAATVVGIIIMGVFDM